MRIQDELGNQNSTIADQVDDLQLEITNWAERGLTNFKRLVYRRFGMLSNRNSGLRSVQILQGRWESEHEGDFGCGVLGHTLRAAQTHFVSKFV